MDEVPWNDIRVEKHVNKIDSKAPFTQKCKKPFKWRRELNLFKMILDKNENSS